jgi:hypothetical protein
MNEQDFKELKRILNLMPGMPLITFSEADSWWMDDICVYWVEDGEEYSEEIYEAQNTIGDYMIVNLRLSTGCTETNIFPMGKKTS